MSRTSQRGGAAKDESSITTREGIVVKPGQLWGVASAGDPRTVTVRTVDAEGGYAHVVSDVGAKSRIAIKNMYAHSKGYRLIRDVEAD